MSGLENAVLDAIALALVTVLGICLRVIWRHGRRFGQMLDDWHGMPSRPGVPGQPGVMERIEQLEKATDEIRYEVKPNGGQSMRDDVRVIREATSPTTTSEATP